MIDKIRLEVSNFYLPYARKDVKHTIEYKGLEFTNHPSYFKDGTCYTTSFVCFYENLRLKIIPDKRLLTIENSLHHYFNRGKDIGNSDDFTLSKVQAALQELSERLAIDLDEALVKEVEFGVNVPVSAIEAYSRLSSYKGSSYEPMKAGQQTYGACCKKNQYRIKAYDKKKQLRLQKRLSIDSDVFRFEIAVTDMTWLQDRKERIPLFFGRHLYDYEVMQRLVNELVLKFKDSGKGSDINLVNLNLRELTAVARLEHKEVCKMVRQNNRRTLKDDLSIYNRLLAVQDGHCSVSRLQSLIKEKAVDLLHA